MVGVDARNGLVAINGWTAVSGVRAIDLVTQFDGMLDKTVILDGFSKTYSMTGWRLGYGVMPTWLADAVNLLMVNSNSCTARSGDSKTVRFVPLCRS